jgi:hypothetical protein
MVPAVPSYKATMSMHAADVLAIRVVKKDAVGMKVIGKNDNVDNAEELLW